ncbi:MAG: hypothetical protein CL685_02790 [Candidatus Magasanikbacteria bacterium]|nr:hypothetical protein [Candidatus Magasanikbacteria bacterium]
MELLLIFFPLLLFLGISYYSLTLGFALFFFLLPTYLIRFSVFSFPTTFFECLFIILFLIFLFREVKQKKIKGLFLYYKNIARKNPTLCIATTLFIIAATISIHISPHLRSAAGAWKAFFIEPLILSAIFIRHIKNIKQIQYILFALVLSGLITSVLAIYQHFTGWMVPWDFWENRNTFRVTAWYGFPNAVGIYLAPIISFALYFVVRFSQRNKKKKEEHIYFTLSCIFIPLGISAILFAKSTGALIGVCAAFGIVLLLYKKTRIPTLLLGTLMCITLFSLHPENPIRQEVLAQDRSGQIRVQMWAESVEYLRANPIFGAGLMGYNTEIRPYRIDKWIEVFHHPHNTLLNMWMSVGFFGMFSFLWIVVWCFKTGYTHIKKRQKALPPYFILSALTTFLVMGLVDSPYIKNDSAMIFWLLVSLLLIQTKKRLT